MSSRGDLESVKDVREAIARIQRYLRGMSYGRFLKDTKTQDAVVRNLEIIGEAAKSVKEKLPELQAQTGRIVKARRTK